MAVPLEGGFTTVAPARQLRGVLNIGDGRTVGVAARSRSPAHRSRCRQLRGVLNIGDDGDIGDWTLTWAQWQELSALS